MVKFLSIGINFFIKFNFMRSSFLDVKFFLLALSHNFTTASFCKGAYFVGTPQRVNKCLLLLEQQLVGYMEVDTSKKKNQLISLKTITNDIQCLQRVSCHVRHVTPMVSFAITVFQLSFEGLFSGYP